MYEIGIENGLVYLDGSFKKVNVYACDGKIKTLSEEKEECKKRIDATGKRVLPGFIDPHVHFALGVGENISKDDFYSGSMEAVFGGVTTYIDFLDPVKQASQITFEFEKRKKLAEKSLVDYAFHTTIANPTDTPEKIFAAGLEHGINSVKLFTTYADTDRRTYDDYILKLLKASKTSGGIVVVHAENDDLLNKGKDIPFSEHAKARPALLENVEVMKLSQMAKAVSGRLYIVHVSAGSSVALLAHNFEQELKSGQIILESCPHYFLLNADCLKEEDGYKYTMTPPLREEEDRKLLFQNADFITTIGTDHCPYTKEQKNQDVTSKIPMGIGGIRYSFLNMYYLYGFSVLPKFTKGPAMAYGLKEKGAIMPGMDADMVIFDEHAVTKVEDEMSVYNGRQLQGKVETVLSGGNIVLDKGQIFPHTGKYIFRNKL